MTDTYTLIWLIIDHQLAGSLALLIFFFGIIGLYAKWSEEVTS